MRQTTYTILICSLFAIFISGCENNNENDVQSFLNRELKNTPKCKSRTNSEDSSNDIPSNQSCVEYSYNNATQKLALNHVNAGFNCCPEKIYYNVSLSNDTILIEEKENNGLCDCNCLYDLMLEVDNVEKTKYVIKFVEPYASNMAQLIFHVDFTVNTTGSYCVTRKKYPWGI